MPEEPQLTNPVEVFYSYAHEDEKLKDELLKHLSNIERQKIIISWHDRKITPGREWAGAIDDHLNTASLILLLVSPDFMASGYCNDVELERAMQRHEAGEARVIPVILRPVDWKGAPFEKLRALPTDGRPVTRRRNRDAALLEVAQGIREAVEEIASRPTPATPRKTREPIIPRPPVVGFVARRDEQAHDIIERLKGELAPEHNHLVALWGPGGAGKTTLAAEFVRDTRELFGGRVAWVSALGRAEFSLATLLDEVATQLGREDLRRLALDAKAAQVSALVSGELTLVVLDNFETISEEEQARCLDFLAQSAACPVLITTRYRVNRDDVYNVPLAAMSMDEARDFLQRLVERTRKPSNFDRLDRDDLIRRCEANPIVLEWVVRQIDLAKRPQDVLDDLARGEGDAAERVFTRSFDLPQLGDDGRAALLALSLFTPAASRQALAEVSGLNDDMSRLHKAIENLSALWLIETTEGNEQLFLHGLTRELAKTRLAKDERTDYYRQSYISYWLHYAELHRQRTPEDLDALEKEKDNMLSAMDRASEMQDWESVMGISDALDICLDLRGYWDEGRRSCTQGQAAARASNDDRNIAHFTYSVADSFRKLGEYDKAEIAYREALQLARKIGNEGKVAACLHCLGWISQDRGDFDEAHRLYTESLEITKKLDDQANIAVALHQLGWFAQSQGDYEEARRLYNESLEIKRRLRNQNGVAITLNNLARLMQAQEELAEARRLLDESLEIARELGNQYLIAITTRNLGVLAERQGDKMEAKRYLREALRILERLGSPNMALVHEDMVRVDGMPD